MAKPDDRGDFCVHDALEKNLNPVGRVFYAASTMICTPASRAQEVGLCLGAQAGEARMRKVVTDGGFTQFRRATQTPFNLVYEVSGRSGSEKRPIAIGRDGRSAAA